MPEINLLKSIFQKIVRWRSENVVSRIHPYINPSGKIIDIGSGTGDIAFLLKQKGFTVTPVDVGNFHGPRLIKTIIYDGIKLPFPDKSFTTALLLMVMHHTIDPDIVFKEAARVTKEIVVIETSFTGPVSKIFTVISDALPNLRLDANWSSYKSDKDWQDFFDKHRFKIIVSKKYNDKNLGIIPFLHILYYLKRK